MESERKSRFVTAVTYLLLLFLVSPMVVVVTLSITPNALAIFPPKGFTLDWYGKVLMDEKFRTAFMTSVTLAVASTTAALLLGTPAALAISRGNIPGSRAIETLLLSPMILPILITGLALLQVFASWGLRSAPINLFIGHTIITLPYVLRTVLTSLSQIDQSQQEAARTLGAHPVRVFWLITLPQIAPGILAGALFAFMISFDDIPISLWLADARTEPLPIYLHHVMASVLNPSVAAMSSLMIATGVVVVLLLEKLVGLRKAMGV